jgi:cytidine deaminase
MTVRENQIMLKRSPHRSPSGQCDVPDIGNKMTPAAETRMPLGKVHIIQLLRSAGEALEKSYSPYSDVRVGAALMGASGRIWIGANIGNSCSTLNCCAEQAAIVQAVLAKDYPFLAIATVQNSGKACSPCGRCLQLLAEFAPDMTVLTRDEEKVDHWPLSYLLPIPFRRD